MESFFSVHLGWETETQKGEKTVPMVTNDCPVRAKTLVSKSQAMLSSQVRRVLCEAGGILSAVLGLLSRFQCCMSGA